jgi:hypothetical protein
MTEMTEVHKGPKDAEAASTSFGLSSASLNPLEGVQFYRNVIAAYMGQYCLLCLCGDYGLQERFRNGRVKPQ